jgi:hypothetical protein
MTPKVLSILPILPIAALLSAAAQSPSHVPQASAPPKSIAETSRISRFLVGPENRPQGFLLRNGTFVMLPLGLAQQLPAAVAKNATVRISGNEFSYYGNKTIEAQSVTVAGVSYNDQGPASGGPPAAPRRAFTSAAPLPPPPPGPPRARVQGGPVPPPTPPCALGAPPPPSPVSGGANAPTPPAEGAPAPPATDSPVAAPAPPQN